MAEVDPFVERIVAGLKGVRGELRGERDKVAAAAEGELAAHYFEGDAEITKSRGSLDFFANLDDEAAGAIEWGGTREDGTPVEGLHIMRRAAGYPS